MQTISHKDKGKSPGDPIFRLGADIIRKELPKLKLGAPRVEY